MTSRCARVAPAKVQAVGTIVQVIWNHNQSRRGRRSRLLNPCHQDSSH